MKYTKFFKDITITDVPLVGGKNASLGEMIRSLSDKGLRIPDGFAVTVDAYWRFLEHNNLLPQLKEVMASLTSVDDLALLRTTGKRLRELIKQGSMPDDVETEIVQSYARLSKEYKVNQCDVAVRSSATAEDLPEASFAGQQETFLNVATTEQLLTSCKNCFASLFTDRAIIYRIQKGFDHFEIGISVGVQKMVRSDKACAGVMFTIDTESGFKDMLMIEASYGLGETVVKGLVTPDEFAVYKPLLAKGFKPLVKKQLGKKDTKLVYQQDGTGTQHVVVTPEEQDDFCLNDEEILELSRAGIAVEDHYSSVNNIFSPMDIEWAKDGVDNKLYILQARPETVHATQDVRIIKQYTLEHDEHKVPLVSGLSIGQHIASGTVRIVDNIKDIDLFKQGDVLVTSMTDPDWVPVMKKASVIITDRGGRTCHAAIVSRELGIPALVGTQSATTTLRSGQKVTVDCAQGKTGYVYEGVIPYNVTEINLEEIPTLPVDVMVNSADPDRAMVQSFLPVAGVGLARIEFIMAHHVRIHPMAACEPGRIIDGDIREEIVRITAAYQDSKAYVVDVLAQGIGMIAASFYPRPVIVRTSDFKSNEYRNLIAGNYFEPEEANPMIGLRGASRYYSELYQPAFALECAALKQARETMGLDNIQIMIPFVRTCDEAERVINILAQHGLHKDTNLKLIMMCEVPSNVINIDTFLKYFDGISIGSNDLTQLTLAIDRDSELLADLFDERDPAVMNMMKMAVDGARRTNKYSGICGQAPSDYPEIAHYLIDCGIDSISLNVDSVMPFIYKVATRK